MSFGMQINTSNGLVATDTVRTPLFYGALTQAIPASATNGTIYYMTYPTNWPSLTVSPTRSMALTYSTWTYTGTLPDPDPEYNEQVYNNYFAQVTFEDANNRVKIQLVYDMPADRACTMRIFFMAECV